MSICKSEYSTDCNNSSDLAIVSDVCLFTCSIWCGGSKIGTQYTWSHSGYTLYKLGIRRTKHLCSVHEHPLWWKMERRRMSQYFWIYLWKTCVNTYISFVAFNVWSLIKLGNTWSDVAKYIFSVATTTLNNFEMLLAICST